MDEIILPMGNIPSCKKSDKLLVLRVYNTIAQEPTNTQNATRRVVGNGQKAELQAIVQNTLQPPKCQTEAQLLQLLMTFEKLFNGTLGDWKIKPASF